jgi:hypothetical protein
MNNNKALRQNNPFNNKNAEINFLLVGISIIVGLIVVIIVYYVYAYSVKKHSSSSSNSNSNSNSSSGSGSGSGSSSGAGVVSNQNVNLNNVNNNKKQVFHIADNIFTYDDAEAVCKAYGGDLADYQQLVNAYKDGANWCNYGWVKGQLALYPIQPDYWNKLQDNNDEDGQNKCGQPGINGGYFENKNLQFGVNCYASKRGPKDGEKIKNLYISDKERELQAKIMAFRKQMGNFTLTPFNENKWSNC